MPPPPVAEQIPAPPAVQPAATIAWLGAQLSPLTSDAAESLGLPPLNGGVLIAGLAEGGPADQAGLRYDDVILKVGPDSVASPRDVVDRIQARRPGDRIEFQVITPPGRAHAVDVILQERPANLRHVRMLRGAWIPELGCRVARLEPGAITVQEHELTPGGQLRRVTTRQILGVLVLLDGEPGHTTLRHGDVITRVAGVPLTTIKELERFLDEADSSPEIELTVYREGKEGPQVVPLHHNAPGSPRH